MKCAMTRRASSGLTVVPGEEVDLETALALFTIAGAHAAHEDGLKGSLTAGKLADLVVLDEDLAAVDADGLEEVGVDEVFLGGRRVA
jgi:predicted amidohydrolase YtcJ